jgi:hypothetical protein
LQIGSASISGRGKPTYDGLLYTIIDFNLRSQTKAWADIRQFRNGRPFRETRFYRWQKVVG